MIGGRLPICCTRCGAYDWTRAPKLAALLVEAVRRRETTTRQLADVLGLSISNAHNQVTRLHGAGLLRLTHYDTLPSGGREATYTATALAGAEVPHARKAAG